MSTSAEICLINQNTAGGGNDFSIDDISFAVQQIVTEGDSILVVVYDKPKVDLGNDTTICRVDLLFLALE